MCCPRLTDPLPDSGKVGDNGKENEGQAGSFNIEGGHSVSDTQ